MTDYTTILDTQVDPEAPITSELMTALRDNPIAITEGASGAPQVQRAAIQNAAVDNTKIELTTTSYSGTVNDSTNAFIPIPSRAFFPSYSYGADTRLEFYNNGTLRFAYTSDSGSNTYSITFTRIA